MIERASEIDRIEVDREGNVAIRVALMLVEDGNPIDTRWHRVTIRSGDDVDAVLEGVSATLSRKKFPAVAPGDAALTKSLRQLAKKPKRNGT